MEMELTRLSKKIAGGLAMAILTVGVSATVAHSCVNDSDILSQPAEPQQKNCQKYNKQKKAERERLRAEYKVWKGRQTQMED
jgi:hypothetical protein